MGRLSWRWVCSALTKTWYNIVSPFPNKPNKQQSHHSWSDGSLCLGLETTFAGHKGCHPFSEFPFWRCKDKHILLSSKLFPTFFYLEGKITNKICTFAPAFCLLKLWCTLRCAELLGRSTTYWKALLTLCFWTFETTTIEQRTRTNAGVTPRGVVYTLRSVLRGSGILNAHLTGVYILLRGCFSVCFSLGLW